VFNPLSYCKNTKNKEDNNAFIKLITLKEQILAMKLNNSQHYIIL